ncbi:MAG: Xaa-Pro aminopeptidase [Saprospiraceae bacterium]
MKPSTKVTLTLLHKMGVKYTNIDCKLFVDNRNSLSKQMSKSSVLVLHSNDLMPRNGDCFFPFRQDSDFFYLTGIDQEESVLLLVPGGKKGKDKHVLFIKETNDHIRVWEGHKYSKNEATVISGVRDVRTLREMKGFLGEVLKDKSIVYFNKNENERASSPVKSRNDRLLSTLKTEHKKHDFVSVAPLLTALRVIKSKEEISLIMDACAITKSAFERVLSMVKPGIGEHEIEAEITHEFISKKANSHAYSPIVASGKNACVLHYIDNNNQCREGDLILLDFGAEYANYASDLSRTIPANGVFSPRQKLVYNAVLRVFKKARANMVEGNTLKKLQESVIKHMEVELVELGLFSKKAIQNQNPEEPLVKKYFMHGTSHFMGLDVHDVGDRNKPFRNGMVLTCEPGLYILEEGIGVRIENDILINGSAPIDLMADIPIEVNEIEALMKS